MQLISPPSTPHFLKGLQCYTAECLWSPKDSAFLTSSENTFISICHQSTISPYSIMRHFLFFMRRYATAPRFHPQGCPSSSRLRSIQATLLPFTAAALRYDIVDSLSPVILALTFTWLFHPPRHPPAFGNHPSGFLPRFNLASTLEFIDFCACFSVVITWCQRIGQLATFEGGIRYDNLVSYRLT